MRKIAVVLCNLGGPDKLESVQPFLFNLFNDKAIIGAPQPIRWLIAKLISTRRAPIAQEIYKHLGGKSPLLELSQEQANALQLQLNTNDEQVEYKCFIAMRYWHPMTAECVSAVKKWGADEVKLLPLYPQFSTTTTGSSFNAWDKEAEKQHLTLPTSKIGCYPTIERFIQSHAALLKQGYLAAVEKYGEVRILFSAHGLPQKIVDAGDPYQWQIEQTASAIMQKMNMDNCDWRVCYQSKVGPLQWLIPSTETEIERAGHDKVAVIIVAIAFVSEHSETLVELDIEYRELAKEHGVIGYERVNTLGTQADYITALAELCALRHANQTVAHNGARLCPVEFSKCICMGQAS